MRDILVMILSTLGTLFILASSVGVLRKPDIYMRISVTATASTLGIGLVLIATAIYFNDYSVTTRLITTIIFVFVTVSIGGHLLARASYFRKSPIWKGTKIDELSGQYDPITHELHSEIHNTSIKPENTENDSNNEK